MADDAKIGTAWRDDELDAIVGDYFEMLEADPRGRPSSLRATNTRSRRSAQPIGAFIGFTSSRPSLGFSASILRSSAP